jgi:hypothetical protein
MAKPLLRFSNSWTLTTLSTGEIVAASMFDRTLRVYSPEGGLQSESLAISPLLALLDRARATQMGKLQIDPSCQCVKGGLPLFGTAVTPYPSGIAISWADSGVVDVLDLKGRCLRSFRLDRGGPETRSPLRSWGLVWSGDRLLRAGEDGVEEFAPIGPKNGVTRQE